jgi:RNA polymerase sigma factor (sigma-70 family)
LVQQVRQANKLYLFEQAVLPHLDAAYNLARWLTHDDQDAQDVAQEAYLRAFKFFDGFHGGDSRAWLLTIVRNTCYTWLQQNRANEQTASLDEEVHSDMCDGEDAESIVLESIDRETLREALEALPVEFREALILRELEGMSYKEIAQIAGIPLGTVMSRLARARKQLQYTLINRMSKDR